jgi:hypothetical protein
VQPEPVRDVSPLLCETDYLAVVTIDHRCSVGQAARGQERTREDKRTPPPPSDAVICPPEEPSVPESTTRSARRHTAGCTVRSLQAEWPHNKRKRPEEDQFLRMLPFIVWVEGTGLNTWDGTVVLAKYLDFNKNIVEHKKIIELGIFIFIPFVLLTTGSTGERACASPTLMKLLASGRLRQGRDEFKYFYEVGAWGGAEHPGG